MAATLADFERKREYLICVDSDGCAVDTMDVKHKRCFGPCMVAEWDLWSWREPILARWDQINLYSMTRGINRFKGLALALGEIDQTYKPIQGVEALRSWAETAPELSEPALAALEDPEPILKKALHWSRAVNKAIADLPQEVKRAFPGVGEGFASVRGFADVAVVSSANRGAVEEEWARLGLLELVDLVLCQDVGSKAHCIGALKEKGYPEDHILMVGDAPGDWDAAKANGVFFYPIQVRHEGDSWLEFPRAADLLRRGLYAHYGQRMEAAFLANLQGGAE